MAESVTVGELLVRLKADMSQLESGLRNGQQAVQGFSNRTRPGLRGVETALRLVGLRAAGITGPVGTLSRTLLAFAPGGLVTAAVIGGLGLIALAWNKIRENAQKAGKEMQDAIARAFAPSDLDQLIHDTELVAINMDEIRTKIERLTQARDALLKRGVVAEAARFNEQIIDQTFALQRARAALILYAEQFTKLTQVQDTLGKVDLPGRLAPQFITRTPTRAEVPSILGGSVQKLADSFKLVGRDIGDIIANDENIQRIVRAFEKQRAAFQEIGQSIGFALQDGIMAVMRGGNFFKAFGLTLLNIGIAVATRGIGNAITGALTTAAVATTASKVAGVGIQGAVDFSNFPAASNPLASARDKDWQRFFRESGLVAASQGFRG